MLSIQFWMELETTWLIDCVKFCVTHNNPKACTQSPLDILYFKMATSTTPCSYSDIGNLRNLPLKEKNFLKRSLQNRALFPSLSKPGKHDWLRSHREQPQSVERWSYRVQTNISASRRSNRNIYLVPLGDDWAESEVELSNNRKKEKFMSLLQRFAALFFNGFEVKILPTASIETARCRTRKNSYSGNLQLYIPDVIKYLESKWQRDAFCVVGITMVDLYPDESWNFVFGQAYPKKGIGVFSFARYNPAFYDDAPSGVASRNTSTLVLWRSCKVLGRNAFLCFFWLSRLRVTSIKQFHRFDFVIWIAAAREPQRHAVFLATSRRPW